MSLICLLPQSPVRLVILLCLCSLRIAQWRLCRTSRGCLEFLVSWEVYSPEERSWDNILDQTLLTIFHANHSTTRMDVLGLHQPFPLLPLSFQSHIYRSNKGLSLTSAAVLLASYAWLFFIFLPLWIIPAFIVFLPLWIPLPFSQAPFPYDLQ